MRNRRRAGTNTGNTKILTGVVEKHNLEVESQRNLHTPCQIVLISFVNA